MTDPEKHLNWLLWLESNTRNEINNLPEIALAARAAADCIEQLQREQAATKNELESWKRSAGTLKRELDEARADVERLKNGTAYCSLYLISEKENDRLRTAIENAHHAINCRKTDIHPCDCFKSEVLKGESS